MRYLIFTLTLSLGLAFLPAHAKNDNPERGFFYYDDPAEEEALEPVPQPRQEAAPKDPAKPVEEKDPCLEEGTWAPECGFINPGNSFSFQARQRDALLQQMVMNPQDSNAVEQFQYYNKWMLDQASLVGSMWEYNLVQNPDLDPSVAAPVSRFGLQIMGDIKGVGRQAIFDMIKEKGILVYFTRSDCIFCHKMAPLVKRLSDQTGITVWNAALDDQCIKGFESRCRTKDQVAIPAGILQVKIVPTLFLYIEPDTWIRVGTGITPTETLKARITNFFTAYQNAMAKGISNGADGKAAVDFSIGDSPVYGTGLAEANGN